MPCLPCSILFFLRPTLLLFFCFQFALSPSLPQDRQVNRDGGREGGQAKDRAVQADRQGYGFLLSAVGAADRSKILWGICLRRRSDGPQPHLVNIQFHKKTRLQEIEIYTDYKLDESYTPAQISVRAGTTFHDIQVGCAISSHSSGDPSVAGNCCAA